MPELPGELADHVRLVGILTVVLGFVAAIACAIGLVIGGFAFFPSVGDPADLVDEAYLALAITGALFLLATWAIAAGAGLLSQQGWARTLTLPLAVISLPAIPFGTLYGGYALWVLTADGVDGILDAPLPWDEEPA